MTMSQTLEDIAERRQGVITRWLASIISGRWAGAADAWIPGLWFATLQRSSLQVPWHRKPWLLPSIGCLLGGSAVGLVAPMAIRMITTVPNAYTMVAWMAILPALCWQVFHARWYFRRLLDRATFEQLMTTPIGSVAVLKDTILHLSIQGLPVFLAALIGCVVVAPTEVFIFILLDFWLWVGLLSCVASGAAWGVSLALSVPLTEQERAERRAKQLAALRRAAVQFGRFCRHFGVFAVRILLPLAAIAGVGWTIGIAVHPALGWLVALLGGMAFIVTLLIMATAKQIGTPMPPLPPMPEPGFKDLWEDRLRRYFDREVTV